MENSKNETETFYYVRWSEYGRMTNNHDLYETYEMCYESGFAQYLREKQIKHEIVRRSETVVYPKLFWGLCASKEFVLSSDVHNLWTLWSNPSSNSSMDSQEYDKKVYIVSGGQGEISRQLNETDLALFLLCDSQEKLFDTVEYRTCKARGYIQPNEYHF